MLFRKLEPIHNVENQGKRTFSWSRKVRVTPFACLALAGARVEMGVARTSSSSPGFAVFVRVRRRDGGEGVFKGALLGAVDWLLVLANRCEMLGVDVDGRDRDPKDRSLAE